MPGPDNAQFTIQLRFSVLKRTTPPLASHYFALKRPGGSAGDAKQHRVVTVRREGSGGPECELSTSTTGMAAC